MAENEDFTFEHATDVDSDTLAAASKIASENSPPVLEDPLDGPVTLPVGFRRVREGTSGGSRFEDVRKAWVRELNGEHEERIARARMREDFSAFVGTVLECGVERLGDQAPTKDDLRALSVADQQYLLLEISRSTFGDELEYEDFECPYCHDVFNVSLSLGDDIPVIRFDKIDDATFEVPLRNDRVATVSLPTGEMNSMLVGLETGPEANTVIIANSVEEIRGPGSTVYINGEISEAKKLSARDRKTLVTAVGDRMAGPQYTGVKFSHDTEDCGKEIRLNVTMADLFREM